jgi:hypothetical protein
MARFNRPRHDDRGPEYNRRYGRYEGAFARRFAVERWQLEGEHRRGRGRFRRPSPPDKEFIYEDLDYSRRWWPADERRAEHLAARRGERPDEWQR